MHAISSCAPAQMGEQIRMLAKLVGSFTSVCVSGLQSLPLSIWEICRHVFDSLSAQAPAGSPAPDISSFLFQAVFCTVIKSPDVYGAVPEPPALEVQRTLTQINELIRYTVCGEEYQYGHLTQAQLQPINETIASNRKIVVKEVMTWIQRRPAPGTTTRHNAIKWAWQEKVLTHLHRILTENQSTIRTQLSSVTRTVTIGYRVDSLLTNLVA